MFNGVTVFDMVIHRQVFIECDAKNFYMVSQRDPRASNIDCGEIGVVWARWRVPSKIASDLSGFRAMSFAQNQPCNKSIQRVG